LNDRIFETFAPAYWAADIPVIPLRAKDKIPAIQQWSAYAREMPTEEIREQWLAMFPTGNIGLPFGSASGLCAIDIDTEDKELEAAIREICGATTYERVGKKGVGLLYRWNGQKNFKLRSADGGMICEFLGFGNQMVLPPSIHPQTGRPYTSSAALWEVLDSLPSLDLEIESELRGLLGAKGFSVGSGARSKPLDVVPTGERDIQLVRHAGYLARVVLGVDKGNSWPLAEAIQHMHTWVADFTANVSGDSIDPGKGVEKLLEFIMKDVEKGRTLPNGWNEGLPAEWEQHPTIVALGNASSARRWDLKRMVFALTDRVGDTSDPFEIEHHVKSILIEAATDPNVDEYDLRRFQERVASNFKQLKIKWSDVKGLVRDQRQGIDGEEWADHEGVARSVLADLEVQGELRFDHGRFWRWSGSCFVELDEADLYMHVATSVKGTTLVRRHGDYESVVKVLKRMCAKPLASVEVSGLNFANGFLDESLRLLEHDPKFGATFTLPFDFSEEAASQCPRWLEFLYDCWGHEEDFAERLNALQEMFAATLFKAAPDYQRAFLLFGRAQTGKTQILNVLRALLPPQAVASLGPHLWDERFTLVDLIGKAANICGELPENSRISGYKFKEVVEGSTVRSVYKGEDGFTFAPHCAHWFASNYLPISHDWTNGFVRRWLILDFNRKVAPEHRVENLAESIVADERDGIAAWAVQGLPRLREQRGYTEPASHTKRLRQVRRINNSVDAFLEDTRMVVPGAGEVDLRDLHGAYISHAQNFDRVSPVSLNRFAQMLEDLDYVVDERRDLTGSLSRCVQGLVWAELRAA
jgi:P4 family phage/plasmid primase-like protien